VRHLLKRSELPLVDVSRLAATAVLTSLAIDSNSVWLVTGLSAPTAFVAGDGGVQPLTFKANERSLGLSRAS
jgi:hypothetical protein